MSTTKRVQELRGSERAGGGAAWVAAYAESLVRTALISLGIQIAHPDSCGCAQPGWDLLAQFGSSFDRIQVRAAKVKNGRITVDRLFRSDGRRRRARGSCGRKVPYNGSEFEYLLAVEIETGVMWLVPMAQVVGKTSLALNGRTPWIGADELPKLHDVTHRDRFTKKLKCCEQIMIDLSTSVEVA